MLTCLNLSKRYTTGPNSVQVLNNFSLTLKPGSFNVLIGGNGAGKSTLVKLIAGSTEPDSGQINLGDQPLTPLPPHLRMRYLSLVQQDPSLGTVGSLTVLENLALVTSKGQSLTLKPLLALRRGQRRLQRAYYEAHLSALNMGLEQHLDTPVKHLSGGQRQALALSLCLLSPTKLLLLDEHTAALDPKASAQLMQLTDTFVRQHQLTTLMITHDLQQALRYGDRLLMLQQGQLTLDLDENAKKALQPKDLLEIYCH